METPEHAAVSETVALQVCLKAKALLNGELRTFLRDKEDLLKST